MQVSISNGNLIITKTPKLKKSQTITTTKRTENRDGSITIERTTYAPKRKGDNFWRNLVIFNMIFRLVKWFILWAYRLFAIAVILIVFFLAMASKPECDHQQVITSQEMITAVDTNDMAQVRLKIQNGQTRPVCK